MNDKDNAIIVDIDGTLSNSKKREHYMRQDKKDWESFYSEAENDEPNEWCLKIVHTFDPSCQILFMTGRPEKYRKLTMKWFEKHSVKGACLLMRPDGDFRPDCVLKKELYEKHIKGHYNILFCIDDRQQVVDMWRNEGLVCLQCAKGDF